MLKIGTVAELEKLTLSVPKRVYDAVLQDVTILDEEYGSDRDYMESGGYAVLLENLADVEELRQIVNFEEHGCEWAEGLGKGSGYLRALYVMNNDYAVMAFIPVAIAPDVILEELEG